MIQKLKSKIRRDEQDDEKFGQLWRFELMERREKGNFKRIRGWFGSLHDQTYGLFFIFFLSLVILIFVLSFSFCSFVFVHPPSLFPIRLLILLHPKYCENVTVYCK